MPEQNLLLADLQRRADEERRRSEEATNRYATVLAAMRAGADPAELLAAAAPLGLSETDLQNFAKVLRREAVLLAAAREVAGLEKKVQTACRAYDDERAEQKRIAEEPALRLLRLGAVVRENSDALTEARNASFRLSDLYARNWKLFGIPEPPQPEEARASIFFGRRPEPEVPKQNLGNCYQSIAIAPPAE